MHEAHGPLHVSSVSGIESPVLLGAAVQRQTQCSEKPRVSGTFLPPCTVCAASAPAARRVLLALE